MRRMCVALSGLAMGCAAESPLDVRPTLAVGDDVACASEPSGTLRCWGDVRLPVPVQWAGAADEERLYVVPPVDVPPGVAHLDASTHLCAVTQDGEIWCWGDASLGSEERRSQAAVTAVTERFVRVRTGYGRTCGVTEGGSLWCWGDNLSGLLGAGTTEDIGDDELTTALGALDLAEVVKDVALGSRETCVLSIEGRVSCWGRDGLASETTAVELPTPARTLVAGSRHMCALLDGGAVSCWGDARAGLLGHGSEAEGCGGCEAGPQCCIGDDEDIGVVELGGSARALGAGSTHSCAVLRDGVVRCWGANAFGALGLPGIDLIGAQERPAALPPVDLGAPAIDVAVGDERTCALLEDRSVRCWGASQRWDGESQGSCRVSTGGPDVGDHGSVEMTEFSCAEDSRCCVGDDEPVSAGPRVPL